MATITFRAIYHDGLLDPEINLDLPEQTLVEVQLTTLPAPATSPQTLFGAFPELLELTGEDFAWAKRLWEHGQEKQSRLLDELA